MSFKSGQEYWRRLGELELQRAHWEHGAEEISEYIAPERGFFPQAGDKPMEPRRRGHKIKDATATRCVRRLAAGLQSGLTSPAKQWFRLSIANESLMEQKRVGDYLAMVEKAMYRVLHMSNFYACAHAYYQDLTLFSPGVMICQEDTEDLARFSTIQPGEYYLAEDAAGRVDTVYRVFYMTSRQLVHQFSQSVSQGVRDLAVRPEGKDQWHKVLHVVQPNHDRDVSRGLESAHKPWESVYLEEGDKSSILRRSGYEEFPYFVTRMNAGSSDIYGRGFGFDVLPDVKQLQAVTITQLTAEHKVVEPPVKKPASLKSRQVMTIPGGVTSVDPGGTEALSPLYQIKPDLPAGLNRIQDLRRQIQDSMLNDVFITNLDNPHMTATEVMERHEEKMLLLGPVIEQQEHDFLNPLLSRVYMMMSRRGLLPPPPPEIQGAPLEMEYLGILAQAQRSQGKAALQNHVLFVSQTAQMDSGVLDKIDLDQAVDEHARITGVPQRITRGDDQVAQMRAARAQAQARQQQQEAMAQQLAGVQQLAGAAKTLSETDTQGPNALTALDQALGGTGAMQ